MQDLGVRVWGSGFRSEGLGVGFGRYGVCGLECGKVGEGKKKRARRKEEDTFRVEGGEWKVESVGCTTRDGLAEDDNRLEVRGLPGHRLHQDRHLHQGLGFRFEVSGSLDKTLGFRFQVP